MFEWGPDQERSMKELKEVLENAVPLGNVDYDDEGAVVLAIDMSWMSCAIFICSCYHYFDLCLTSRYFHYFHLLSSIF